MSKLIIHRLETRERYTKPVDMRFITDTRVSPEGRLAGVYLLSLLDGWSIDYAAIQKVLGIGRDATRAAVDSLKNAGYLVINKDRGDGGKLHFTWVIHEASTISNPHTENPYTADSPKAKQVKGNKATKRMGVATLPHTEKPYAENPYMVKTGETPNTEPKQGGIAPHTENPYAASGVKTRSLTVVPDTPLNKYETNIKNNPLTPIDLSSASPMGVGSFEEFWSLYPKKVGKKETKAYWERHKLGSKLPEILAGVEAWKKTEKWTKDGGAYVWDPIRFLKGEHWTDEIPAPKPEPGLIGGRIGPSERDKALLDAEWIQNEHEKGWILQVSKLRRDPYGKLWDDRILLDMSEFKPYTGPAPGAEESHSVEVVRIAQ